MDKIKHPYNLELIIQYKKHTLLAVMQCSLTCETSSDNHSLANQSAVSLVLLTVMQCSLTCKTTSDNHSFVNQS